MSNDYPLNFEIAGVKFRGAFLSPERSLDAFAILAPAMSQVLEKLDPKLLKGANSKDKEAMQAMGAQMLGQALTQFRDLPKMRPYFLGQYEVFLENEEQRVWLTLPAVEDQVFGGKPLLMVGFLVAAIKSEYADFLVEKGLSIFSDMARALGFRLTLKKDGPSGG